MLLFRYYRKFESRVAKSSIASYSSFLFATSSIKMQLHNFYSLLKEDLRMHVIKMVRWIMSNGTSSKLTYRIRIPIPTFYQGLKSGELT